MVLSYLLYLLAYKTWMYESEGPTQFLEPPSQSLKENHTQETILAAGNPNLEYPRREDFYVAMDSLSSESAQWMKPSEAESNFYACGFTIKNEASLTFGDDSANNAFKIHYCLYTPEGEWRYSEDLNYGEFGTWGRDYICPSFSYISGVEVIREYYTTGMSDYSSINGLYLYCKDFNGKVVKEINAHDGSWGSRRSKVEVPGKFVCGAQVAYDNKNGFEGDRIGLDGLLLKFCNWDEPDNLSSIIEGNWGIWRGVAKAKNDYLACGFRIRFDISGTDMSGMSGMKIIFCNIYDWSMMDEVTVIDGFYGNWEQHQFCPQGQFIDSVQLKNLESQGPGKDDLAVVGLSARCSLPSDRSQTNQISNFINEYGTWGEIKDFSPNYLCAVRGRLDLTSKGRDATGLTGLRIKFCEYKNDQKDYVTAASSNYGEWQTALVPAEGRIACGLKIRTIDFYPGYNRINSMSFVYCSYSNWGSYEDRLGGEKYGFNNKYNEYICPRDYFIDWINIKRAKVNLNGKEITSVNGIEFNCYGGSNGQKIFKHEFRQAGEWSLYKYDEKFLCADQQLLEPFTAHADVSGLYGLKLKFCPAWYTAGKFSDIVIGNWGEWYGAKYVEKDYFSCGVSVQISKDHASTAWGTNLDAMGIMGLQLINCHKDDWNNKGSLIKLEVFKYGTLKTTMCPEGSFIVGAAARFQPPQGSKVDDEAVNGLKIFCSKSRSGGERTELIALDSVLGSWLQPVIGQGFVCGGQARIDTTQQFVSADATGLNGLSFKFC